MTDRKEKESLLAVKHDLGKLSLKDDAVLMRLKVKTDKEPTEALKAEIQRLYLGYFITWERF